MYGSSTGWLPNHIKTTLKDKNHQINLGKDPKREILWLDFTKANSLNTIMANTKPINPPSLLGIERRTAYKCRKYHSGWIWIGDLERSLGTKFTGSADQSGDKRAHIHINHRNLKLTISLNRNKWVNFILITLVRPPGVLLPLKCSRIKWIPAKPKTKNGTKKWAA